MHNHLLTVTLRFEAETESCSASQSIFPLPSNLKICCSLDNSQSQATIPSQINPLHFLNNVLHTCSLRAPFYSPRRVTAHWPYAREHQHTRACVLGRMIIRWTVRWGTTAQLRTACVTQHDSRHIALKPSGCFVLHSNIPRCSALTSV